MMRDLQEKRLALVVADELDGPVGEILRSAPRVFASRDPSRQRVPFRFFDGLPTLLIGTNPVAAKMPFAEVPPGVTGGLQPLRKRLDFQRQMRRHNGIKQSRERATMRAGSSSGSTRR